MLDRRPQTPRRVLLLVAAIAVLMAPFATRYAYPAEGLARSESLADVWALEVTPEFAHAVKPHLVARARDLGINTIVLNRHLSREQKQRVGSLARRFQLLAFQPRRQACKRETVETCAVVAQTPAAVERLVREPHVDIVVLRLRRPALAPGLSRKHELAVGSATTARLLLLPMLTVGSRFSQESWRRAISAVAEAQTVSLGATPSGRSGERSFGLFLRVLASERADKDKAPPSVPSGIKVSKSTQTSVSIAWNAASDKVGVKTYSVYNNGTSVGTTASPAFTITGLACGTAYALAVDASDEAGNRSGSTSVWAATAACAPPPPSPVDSAPPSPPSELRATQVTRTSVSLSWTPASDNVGVVSYRVYRNGASVATTASRTFTIAGLACGTAYALAVDASDAAGNRSGRVSVSVVTAVCPPPPPPPPLPPPPPPPPPLPPIDAGMIVFDADYETGNISQWTWGAQCANTSSAPLPFTRGTITLQSEIVAQGRYAARIDLPGASDITACEGIRKRTLGTGHGSPAKSEWYSISVRFPTNLHTNKWGMTFGQPNYQGIHGSPLHFYVYGPNDASREPFHVRLVAQAGLCNAGGPGTGCQWSNGLGSGRDPMKLIPSSRFTLGVWHDLLVHVVWTTNGAEALYEGWHRPRGGTWSQTINYAPGQPSVQWSLGDTAQPTDTTMDKFGAYRGANSQPTSIWHDNICVATSRAAAESCF